ncbi:MAG: hypothetical protein CL503_01550 [Actinobacteria bacterium]|nr:hypothetical protein [Actinomycetota bacterium]|tara:strand:- start:1954 stop:2928 length:975 start_codon:yes stop_codon:yes gene_type:complete
MTWKEPSKENPTLYLPLTQANPDLPLDSCTITDKFSIKVSPFWLSIWKSPNNSSTETLCQNLLNLLAPLAELTIIAQQHIPIHSKNEPHDLVTDTDIGIELLLKKWFNNHLPNHKLIGEETKKPTINETDICWYLDPIDGTANYASKKDNFCINLGSTFNGNPYINIVYHPKTKTYHYQTPKQTSYKALTNPEKKICTEFYPHRTKEKAIYDTILKQTNWQPFQTQALGISLYEMMNGKCSAFYKPNGKPWDIMAGAAILSTSDYWDITFVTKTYQAISLFSNEPNVISYLNDCFKTNCRIGTLIITPRQNPKLKEIIINTLQS